MNITLLNFSAKIVKFSRKIYQLFVKKSSTSSYKNRHIFPRKTLKFLPKIGKIFPQKSSNFPQKLSSFSAKLIRLNFLAKNVKFFCKNKNCQTFLQ